MLSFNPASSHIANVQYDEPSETLTVEFMDGSQYEYYHVPLEVYSAFSRAPSAGAFFARQIKNRYAYDQA